MPREIASVDNLFNDKINNMAQNAATKDSSVDAFGNHKVVLDDIVNDETSHTLTDEELGNLFDMASADASGLGDAEEIVTTPKDKNTSRSRRHKDDQLHSRRKKEETSVEEQEEPKLVPDPFKKTENESAGSSLIKNEPELDEVELPDWADSIRRKVNASVAHAFLLNGNVRDYMVRNVSIEDGIVLVLDPTHENFDVIAHYDQARGISFYGADILTDDGRYLNKIYEERFLEEMQESQKRMSMKISETIPNQDAVTLFTVLSDMFNHASKTRQAKILLFVDYSDLLVPDASSAQMKPDERKLAITLSDIGRSQMADEAGNVMIFITDDMSQLSSRIRSSESRIEQVLIPIPDREERTDFIDNVLDIPENTLSDGTQIFEHPESIDKTTFAINSAGLSRKQIEDILLRALSDDEPLTLKTMKDRKNEIIKEDYDDVLEIIDPKFGYDSVGGSDMIKRLFMDEIINPVHAGETEACPMGVLIPGPPGTGKSITQNTTVPTPKGPIQAGKIEIGDKIFGTDGKEYAILGKYPQGKLDVYRLTLEDGRSVECSGDHLWTVSTKEHGEYIKKTMTTLEILEHGLFMINSSNGRKGQEKSYPRYLLEQATAVEYKKAKQELDPYVMGTFLSDGCKNIAGTLELLSADEENVAEVTKLLGTSGYKQRKTSNEEYITLLTNTHCHDKYIPSAYKYASIEQRWNLIQGMMDIGGCVCDSYSKNSHFNLEFPTTSERLANDFAEVLRSLGIYCSIDQGNRTGQKHSISGKEYECKHNTYSVKINVPNETKPKFFRFSYKKKITNAAAKTHKTTHHEHIGIVSIEPLHKKEEMVCFTVGSPDHLFLVGDYVPTHNTMISKATAYEAKMNFVALNLNRLMDKWLGATERNLDRALQCAVAMAPTVIFIDEIDEALPNRNDPNASSVNKRINQRLLTFFSDTSHRGQVIILAATNYPSKIDPAFKRAGRFDVRIPMFAPDEFDRMRIMRVVAKNRGYTFSWFEDPDELIPNPFIRLKEWIIAGNAPDSNPRVFSGDLDAYNYKTKNSLGKDINHEIYLPKKLITIIGKKQITLQQFYESARILFMDMPERKPDSSSGEIISDEELYKLMQNYLNTRTDILGDDPKIAKIVMKRLWRWETIYKPFSEQTFRMTGAELDVVMSKSITLYKRWLRETDPKLIQKNIAAGVMKDDHDIPWKPFLLHACYSTVNAVAGIKSMEDDALLNTSDLDYIPDALYAESDDGRLVSYHERQEELVAKQTKSLLG